MWYNGVEVDKMLYNGDNPIIQIVSVERIRWDGGTFEVAPRKFSALSLRIGGSTTVYAKGKEYFINTNDILSVTDAKVADIIRKD